MLCGDYLLCYRWWFCFVDLIVGFYDLLGSLFSVEFMMLVLFNSVGMLMMHLIVVCVFVNCDLLLFNCLFDSYMVLHFLGLFVVWYWFVV